jgi:hypothetical protein
MGEDDPARGSRIGVGELGMSDRAACLMAADEGRRRYLADGNPLHVWDAVLCLHAAHRGAPSLPLPAWAANYLADVALALARLGEAGDIAAKKGIAGALGLASPGRSAFQKRKAERRVADAWSAYQIARHLDGRSANDARELVAGLLGGGASDVADRARHVKRTLAKAKTAGLALATPEDVAVMADRIAAFTAEAERIVAAINKDGDGTKD